MSTSYIYLNIFHNSKVHVLPIKVYKKIRSNNKWVSTPYHPHYLYMDHHLISNFHIHTQWKVRYIFSFSPYSDKGVIRFPQEESQVTGTLSDVIIPLVCYVCLYQMISIYFSAKIYFLNNNIIRVQAMLLS